MTGYRGGSRIVDDDRRVRHASSARARGLCAIARDERVGSARGEGAREVGARLVAAARIGKRTDVGAIGRAQARPVRILVLHQLDGVRDQRVTFTSGRERSRELWLGRL